MLERLRLAWLQVNRGPETMSPIYRLSCLGTAGKQPRCRALLQTSDSQNQMPGAVHSVALHSAMLHRALISMAAQVVSIPMSKQAGTVMGGTLPPNCLFPRLPGLHLFVQTGL